MTIEGYMDANRRNWDDRARLHAAATTGYQLDRFRDDRSLLSDVIEFDRRRLGDLDGLRVLHLQCHIGTDTLSLARLGAQVTGLDQSGASLDAARALFESVDTPARFVTSNLYDAVETLDGEQFDLVYTGVGSLNWLPDIARWGRVVGALVRDGGRFYIREGHPMLVALDDERTDNELHVRYPYFETVEPMTFDHAETYVDTGGATLTDVRSHEWNHGLAEVFTALTGAGLHVTAFDEHRFLDWRFFSHQVERDGVFHLPDDQLDMVPMMYSFAATKPA